MKIRRAAGQDHSVNVGWQSAERQGKPRVCCYDRSMSDFDICIVGAGPAGAAAATFLARQGRSVALLDRSSFPREKICGDGITPRGGRVLQRLGLYEPVQRQGYACSSVMLRGVDGRSFSVPFEREVDTPSDVLVIPRLVLDPLLVQHAEQAGAHFTSRFKAVQVIEHGPGRCEVVGQDGESIHCRLAVLATGVESQLLRASGLLAEKPPLEHAARAYFDNVTGLSREIMLFFDGVDLPGYGWVFPTSASSANVGCGVFGREGRQQIELLRELVQTHPLLAPMLAHASAGPIRAYPLRTDYQPSSAGQGSRLCIGEAAGLVNPITGEGIDYALESAEYLAAAVQQHWQQGVLRVATHYRHRLAKRFDTRFRLYRMIRQRFLAPERAERFVAGIHGSPAMQRLLVAGLFGRARPSSFLQPAILARAASMLLR